MKYAIFCLVFTAMRLFSGEDANDILQAGMAALRAEDNVAAIKAFVKASELAEAAGDEAKMVELGGLIYWTKKRFSLAQASALHQDERVEKRVEIVTMKKVEPSEADKWLERAQKTVSEHKDDALRCAVAMFSVADRFPMTDSGRKAMTESLAWMAKIKTEAKVQAKVVTPTAVAIHGAEIVFQENMGYIVDELKTGAPMHSNVGTTYGEVPPELSGKQYTQVVGKKGSPVKVSFATAGTIYILLMPNFPEVYTANARVIQSCGKKTSIKLRGTPDPKLSLEVWALTGQAGQSITFPTQLILVADKLTKVEKM